VRQKVKNNFLVSKFVIHLHCYPKGKQAMPTTTPWPTSHASTAVRTK